MRLSHLVLTAAAAALIAPAALAAPTIGQPAPAFEARDADGKVRSLSEFKGKTVVLEWTNNGCPYVQKHYGSGSMQKLQKSATADGVVWLTIVSSAPGTQGYLAPADAKVWKGKAGIGSTDLLLDPEGKVGRTYAAQTTPHMYVVDKTGKLAYMGAIDDKPTNRPADLAGAKNYVVAALADLKAGRTVAQPVTRSYGCSVKYKDAG
jgi:hypothetical protein